MHMASTRLGPRHDDVQQHASERHADRERVEHLDFTSFAGFWNAYARMRERARSANGLVDKIRAG
jgi:hypothetical protein